MGQKCRKFKNKKQKPTTCGFAQAPVKPLPDNPTNNCPYEIHSLNRLNRATLNRLLINITTHIV